MRELSLFTGAGGGVLGSKILGWKTVGYVEWEEYPQKVIAQRIKDGIFDEAPIFTEVREFAQSGAARQYRGFVDVVTGGFPCQPFSVAGKRKASDDERNMWPATLDVIKAVKPPIVYLENVPGLLSATVDDGSGRPVHYFGIVLRDLAESGYRVGWCVLGADDVGTIHHRKRVWIYATNTKVEQSNESRPKIAEHPQSQTPKFGDSDSKGVHSDSGSQRVQRDKQETLSRQCRIPWGEDIRSISDIRNRSDIPEPIVWGGDDGVADRSNRLKAIGNGQVPLTMACAYEILFQAVGG